MQEQPIKLKLLNITNILLHLGVVVNDKRRYGYAYSARQQRLLSKIVA